MNQKPTNIPSIAQLETDGVKSTNSDPHDTFSGKFLYFGLVIKMYYIFLVH